MNANQQNFQYVMPEDDEDEYVEDDEGVEDGDEMINMDDDEAQSENDQINANQAPTAVANGGMLNHPGITGAAQVDENTKPLTNQQDALAGLTNNKPGPDENAYQIGNHSNGFQAKQIQNINQMAYGNSAGQARMRPQSAKTMPSAEQHAFNQM